jgi:hypothetical protein
MQLRPRATLSCDYREPRPLHSRAALRSADPRYPSVPAFARRTYRRANMASSGRRAVYHDELTCVNVIGKQLDTYRRRWSWSSSGRKSSKARQSDVPSAPSAGTTRSRACLKEYPVGLPQKEDSSRYGRYRIVLSDSNIEECCAKFLSVLVASSTEIIGHHIDRLIRLTLGQPVLPSGRLAVGVGGGVSLMGSVNLTPIGENPNWPVATALNSVVCFCRSKS